MREIDRERPSTDRELAEATLQRHFAALGVGPFPIRWVVDVEAGCREALALARKESRKLRWKRFVTALWAAVADGWPAGEGTPESVRKWESELGSLPGFVTLMNPEYVAACVAAGLRVYAAQRQSQGGSGGACRVVLEAAESAALHKKWGWRVFDPSEDVQRCLYAGYVLVAAGKAAFQWTSSAIVPSNGLEAPPGWWRTWLGPEWAARRAARHAALGSRRSDWVRETLLPVWDPTWCLWPAFLSKAGSGGKGPAFDAYRAVWGALMEAAVAGLWSCWVLDREVLAAPRPSLRISRGQVHCADGPAISWPGGAALCLWRGVRVPRELIEAPDKITVAGIRKERNVEVRSAMIERYGRERFLRDARAKKMHEDEFGTLYYVLLPGREPVAIVKVADPTPGDDGSPREHCLRVPPTMGTAHEAVAWTFGLRENEYAPTIQA